MAVAQNSFASQEGLSPNCCGFAEEIMQIAFSLAFEQLYLTYFCQSFLSATCVNRSRSTPPDESNYVSVFLLNNIEVNLRKHRVIAFLAKNLQVCNATHPTKVTERYKFTNFSASKVQQNGAQTLLADRC